MTMRRRGGGGSTTRCPVRRAPLPGWRKKTVSTRPFTELVWEGPAHYEVARSLAAQIDNPAVEELFESAEPSVIDG